MKRFGSLEEQPLDAELRQAVMTDLTGSITVSGPGDGGRIWLERGQVALAVTDSQPAFASVLTAVGAVDDAGLVALQESVGLAPVLRPQVTSEVVAVAQEVTDRALERLLSLPEGTWRTSLDDQPPLGVLTTRGLDEVLAAVRRRRVVEATRRVQERGRWGPVAEPPAGRIRLQPDEWRLLVAMGEAGSPAEIAQRGGWSITQVRRTLTELAKRGLIERLVSPAPGQVPTAPAEVFTPHPGRDGAPATPQDTAATAPSDPTPPAPIGSAAAETAEATPPRREAGARPTAPVDPQPTAATPVPDAAGPDQEPTPVGVGARTAGDADAWTARGAGTTRAVALRRLIGAVRRL